MALPPELLEKLQELHDRITNIEDAVDPLLEVPYEEHCQRPPLDRARIDLTTLFTVNSLYWIYQACSGKDPKEMEELVAEVERTKKQSKKFQEVEDLSLRPQINKRAAKSFVRNALFDVNDPGASTSDMNEDWEAQPDSAEVEKLEETPATQKA